jgi:hypothetical protein
MVEMFKNMGFQSPFRASTMALASVYLLGLIALIWAPETKGKPLPEE